MPPARTASPEPFIEHLFEAAARPQLASIAWYVDDMAKAACDALVAGGSVGCFLVRRATQRAGRFLLTYNDGAQAASLAISVDGTGRYTAAGRAYESLPDLVATLQTLMLRGPNGSMVCHLERKKRERK